MPKPLKVDWNAIRASYMQGHALVDVASAHGVSYGAIRARSARENWTRDQEIVTAKVSQAVTVTLEEKARVWTNTLVDVVEKHLDHIKTVEPGQLKLSEFETLTRILGNTDATARRTFGLDKPDASRQAAVGIKVNLRIDTNASGPCKSDVVDADVVAEDGTPPASTS